ncbi:MAG: SLC13 family permease [Nitrospirota bacterium]|nr:SLC13 family permease [Nitrospirota bacterium]
MSADLMFVFGLLAVTIALFVSDRVRLDVVALLVIIVLPFSGVLTMKEAVSGFGEPVVLLIAALFVVGEGLFRTGVAASVGVWLLRVGGTSETRLLLYLIPAVALLSAFMSSTGAVALFIPVVMSLARKSGISPSRLLMPLAFGSLIGGMMTLIGTPPNVVVSSRLQAAGQEPFGFFDFTPIGLVMLAGGMAYMILAGRFLLPGEKAGQAETSHPPFLELAARYGIDRPLDRLVIGTGSALIGRTVIDAGMRRHHEVTVVGLRRRGRLLDHILPVLADTVLQAGDELFVMGDVRAIDQICHDDKITRIPFPEGEVRRMRNEFGVAEVMIAPESGLAGKSIQQGSFRQRLGLSVVAVRRGSTPIDAMFSDTRLEIGDTLLVAGAWSYIERLSRHHQDLVVLETPAEMDEVAPNAARAPLALGILAVMLVLMTTGWISALGAALIAALAMVLSGCLRMEEAYRGISWSSLVLIAGMLPLSLALQKTGGIELLAGMLTDGLGGYGPLALCAGLFVLTSLFSQVISNTATTVLVAPIALTAAQAMGLSAEPFMMTVALAASTAFSTPIASPVNTLVLAPGGYRFGDFLKVGVPLQLIAMAITLTLVPLLFRF